MTTEHPILFTGEMVRAILAGRKTQTRRVVKSEGGFVGGRFDSRNDPRCYGYENGHGEWFVLARGLDGRGFGSETSIPCPHGEAGHTLWVRETWRVMDTYGLDAQIHYDATNDRRWVTARDTATRTAKEWIAYLRESEELGAAKYGRLHRGRPSIHMPRWACRLQLDVASVGVERVQMISEPDAVAEGIMGTHFAPEPDAARERFRELWDSINAARGFSWASNPWVWVIRFGRCDA